MMYRESELREACLDYFNGDILATNVWIKKYALKAKEEENYYELTPKDTLQRIATEIHRTELKYPNPLSLEEITETIDNFKHFIFGGSILFGLGNNNAVSSLGNCFFIDNGADSYGGIFNIDESMVQLMKRRGGVGITLEHLRPSTAGVNNAAQSSTGAVSFMKRYSESTREVAQDGRRGALMITMHINHPDVLDFVMAKDDLTKITGANISVKVSDEFMRAVEHDQDYILSWPTKLEQLVVNEQLPYNKLMKIDGNYVKRVKAKELWNAIIKQAHKNAEPGIIFWDNVIKESPADAYKKFGFETKGTNPCGEVPLSAFDSCRLGSINVYNLVENPFTPKARFLWDKLARTAKIAQRFMDDIVDLEEEKVLAIIEKVKNDPEDPELKRTELRVWEKVLKVLKDGRRTGIGILGLGDMFAALGIQYGTPKATKFEEDIQKFIAVNSYRESVKLAKERGAFLIWDADVEAGNPFIRRIIGENFDNKEYDEYLKYGRRNIATMSIAPTGTLAILAQTTSGIEPVFKIFYRRRRKINPNESGAHVSFVDQNGDSWEEYNVIHYPFITWFMKNSDSRFTFNGAHGFLKDLTEEQFNKLIEVSPWNKSESHDVDPIEKVTMQGVIQKWIDHSISVTHNLPEKITLDEVNKIYFHGWKSGCKGLTIYREGSRSGVLISKKEETDFKENNAPKRPKVLEADYYVASAMGTQFAVIVGKYQNKPYEVFAFENPPRLKNTSGKTIKVKKGHYKFVNGEFEIDNLQLASERREERMLTLTASMLLRHGAPINHVIHVIKKIDETITSFSSVVRRCLSKYIEETVIDGEGCPNCGDKLIMQDGCVKCVNPECGYSRCG
jgi:ribonucleoside-diphosphate reductase alpha chain